MKKAAQKAQEKTKSNSKKSDKSNSFSFEANKFQLLGTIPKDLRHKYVAYRPILAWIFSGKGIRGWILQRALHAQHRKIYCYDLATQYGVVASPPEVSKIGAGDVQSELPQIQKVDDIDEFAASKQFLHMVHYDESAGPNIPGGRMYTYVITLQGEWRFTETGPEFSIQHLSKHSMHSDVSQEIACAGEFFIRRRRRRGGMKFSNGDGQVNEKAEEKKEKNELQFQAQGLGSGEKGNGEKEDHDHDERKDHNTGEDGDNDEEEKEDKGKDKGDHNIEENRDNPSTKTGLSDGKSKQDSVEVSNKPSHKPGRSRDPRNFVLIIDNDSGTYRPDAKTLPSLQKYLASNLLGLKVKAMACDDEKLKKWKEEQKPKKQFVKAMRVVETSSSSSSEEDNWIEDHVVECVDSLGGVCVSRFECLWPVRI